MDLCGIRSRFYGALSVWRVVHSHKLHSPAINKLAVRHFLCCSGAYGLLSQCLGEAVADTWPFDPYYFPLQTIDFNYQTALSAAASSSACVPRSVTAEEVRVISCNMAACFCHFGSVLPITVEENLMACYPHFSVVFKGWYCYCRHTVCKGTITGYNIQRWAFQGKSEGENNVFLGAKRWEAGQGVRGDLKW